MKAWRNSGGRYAHAMLRVRLCLCAVLLGSLAAATTASDQAGPADRRPAEATSASIDNVRDWLRRNAEQGKPELPDFHVVEFTTESSVDPTLATRIADLRAKVGSKPDHPLRSELEAAEARQKQGSRRGILTVARRGDDAVVTSRTDPPDPRIGSFKLVMADGLVWWDNGRTVTLRPADEPVRPGLDAWPIADSIMSDLEQFLTIESGMARLAASGSTIRAVAGGWEAVFDAPGEGLIRLKIVPDPDHEFAMTEISPVSSRSAMPTLRLTPSPPEARPHWPTASIEYLRKGQSNITFRLVSVTPISAEEFASQTRPPSLAELEARKSAFPGRTPVVAFRDLRDPVVRAQFEGPPPPVASAEPNNTWRIILSLAGLACLTIGAFMWYRRSHRSIAWA
jgi:hypothetical protein